MSNNSFIINQLSELSKVSKEIIELTKAYNLFLFEGEMGSGKTTLLRSLIGFHLPTEGVINLGGYDIKNIPSKEFRSYVGYCPQKVQLFTGSIYENITAGFEDASEDDVIEASSLACSHDFIAKLPGGYNYQLVDGGANLSGGQRQAIALSRSLLRKPKLLILDEPTSSMDANTEQTIIDNIMSLPYNPTIIISTHRTNHLVRTDKIGVIVDGKLAAFGPREDILKESKSE